MQRVGCDVLEINTDLFIPQWRKLSSRLAERLLLPLMMGEFNAALLQHADQYKPEFLITTKGPYILPETLRKFRKIGIKTYNYYPDTSAFAHGKLIPQALPEYDCVFYTKPFWDADVRTRIHLRESTLLPHGYDPDVHKIHVLNDADKKDFGHDVVVIASYTAYKEHVLSGVLRLLPDMDFCLWGHGWQVSKNPAIRKRWARKPLAGTVYSKALQAAKINLALTSGVDVGSSQGDNVTTRSYQIPACGGFMLHPRNEEILQLYEEGKQVACYGDAEEAAGKIRYYLDHPEERESMALAAHQRCVPAYSYDARMSTLLAWHRKNEV